MATYTGTPHTWTVGEQITADLLNDIRDFMLALSGAWTSWTPTVSQGTATSIAKTVTYAKYVRVGRFVVCQWNLAITENGGGSGAIRISLPVTAATSALEGCSGTYYNQDGSKYKGVLRLASTTTVEYVRADTTTDDAIGTSPAIECSSGDYAKGLLVYEAAA